MKRTLSMLAGVLLAAGLCIVPAGAVDTNITLRVGLTEQGVSADPKLENVSGYVTGYTFGKMDGTAFVGDKQVSCTQLTMRVTGGAVQAANTATGEVLYTAPAGSELAVRPNSALTWFKGYQWPGSFVYRITGNNQLTVINYVAMEDYVKGVLPYEVDPDWPAEALKAQAVCARSFALGTHKHTASGYDLCNTTNCQVYRGANRATAGSNAAVDATRGEYLTYQGEPVIGYFFSSDGGATEDAVNVWGGDYAYLKGKADPYEGKVDEWSVTLTAAEIRQKLQSAGHAIGEVANVQITKRTAMDNVNEVTVTDKDGKQVTVSRDAVRTVFGLKSIRYTITPNAGGTAAALPESRSLQVSPSVHKVTVDGKAVQPQGYNINGNNYYKLRDIAYILNGTSAQFNVTWDKANNRIALTASEAYQPVGGEMAVSGSTRVEHCVPSSSSVVLGGKAVSLTGYNINGNNYYKLRDVGEALGFGVGYANQTVAIQSEGSAQQPGDNPPAAAAPASYTFKGSGWGHSVGMSQWGAYAMAKEGFDYEDILKFYYTGIAIAR